MDLEKWFGNLELLNKEYFNFAKKNLDMLLIHMETNSLDLVKKINVKDSEQQCSLIELQKFRISSIEMQKVKLSEEIKMENYTQ